MVRLNDARKSHGPASRPASHSAGRLGDSFGPAERFAGRALAAPRSRAFTVAHDVVETDQIFLGGQAMGMAISLGDRLQFFTTLEDLRDLDGVRFANRAELIARLRLALADAA